MRQPTHDEVFMNRTLLRTTAITLLAIWAMPATALDDAHTVLASPTALRTLAPYRTLIEAKGAVALVESSLGTGQIVLDVLDGKAPAAAIAMPLAEAVDAARVVAWEQHRLLIVPETIEFHSLSGLSSPAVPVGFVTIGKASPSLKDVLLALR
jgi:hypothetical protein